MVETYMSYLPQVLIFYCVSSLTNGCRWDYVLVATKVTILGELAYRIYVSEDDAQVVVDSPVFHYIWENLGSPDPMARRSSCNLLDSLAKHECTIPHMLEMRGCERLLALLE
jgi:hypothetical protein